MIALALALSLLHDESISTSRIDVGSSDVTITFTFLAADRKAIGADVFAYVRERVRLWSDDIECTPELVQVEPLTLRYTSTRPIGRLRMACALLSDHDHKHVADTTDGRTFVFNGKTTTAEWSAPASLGSFIVLGIAHIVTGWDHLIFLLTLLVVAASAGRVLQLVTAFTIAHSITLGLTALRIIGPPAAIVESVIAASIIYVAIENVAVKEVKWRWALVFAFGLVHGMGFGGVLLEMDLARPAMALLGFNLGVEFGQLAIVALAYPLLVLLRRREDFYRRYFVRGLSGAAAAAGVVWLIERAL